MKLPKPPFLSSMISRATTALIVIILMPVMVVMTFKILDRIGGWLLLGMVLIAVFRIARALIDRHRQEW
jgi:hypothetical protein